MKFIWSIIIIINLYYTSSFCYAVDNDISTYPEGDINILYPGNPLEVYCSSKNTSSKDLYFHAERKNLTSEVVNETTIRLYIEQPQPQKYILYCKSETTRKNRINAVLVDQPPLEVTDFKCISKNLDSLNCSWTSNVSSNMVYELYFIINSKPTKTCTVQKLNNIRYCIWGTDSSPRYRQQVEIYNFNLLSKNVFGERMQNFKIDHYSIVKPDKPFNGTILEATQHSVNLFWEIPVNMIYFLPQGIDHKIEYQLEKRFSFQKVNASLPARNKQYTFNLTKLPYTPYEVQISIRPKNAFEDQFWSDPLVFHFPVIEIKDTFVDDFTSSLNNGVYLDLW